MDVRVKICCISSIEEANLAIKYGASALGLVGKMPSGPGVIDDNLIRKIVETVPPPISTFLLTSETNANDVIAHYQRVHTSTIQMVDNVDHQEYEKIRTALPHVKLVQVIHVIDEESVAEAIEISEYVDALLLDSGNPNLPIKELGGTGRAHDWNLSKKICESVSIPVFLAGGICKDNVNKAIEVVKPFGVDLCSSVRTNGALDENKLREFFETIG
ncbi:phosphoribosylanthranilate isomerase [Perlabentimonas gracilis]|uniref:phosphoribosylanthranilate isomerase n=1 Tax=Perlabentimonas gracilis TaxID=2715279 RepID=UPI00140E3F50|nr:phosphoribosylanthranilate isomerase [Perlabentimonas gracilis]NHB67714.1 phosphoribosylanthranilate isomerase [Perlabentimonas gracilis]